MAISKLLSKSIFRFLKAVCLCLLLIGCAATMGKPLLHGGLGAAAKILLSLKTDWKLAYHSLEWKDRQIVIANAVLFDDGEGPSSFHAQIEKVAIQLDWKDFPKRLRAHVAVDRPRVNVDRLKPLRVGGGWFQWTLAVREGTAALGKMEPVLFSFEKTAVNQLGRLKLDWPGSSLSLEGREEGKETKIDVEVQNFPGTLAQSLISFLFPSFEGVKIGGGVLEGSFHCSFEEKSRIFGRSAGHLEMKKISFLFPRCEAKEAVGAIDWEGSLAEKKGLLGDLFSFSFDGKMRGSFSRLEFKTRLGEVKNLAGEFTYNSGLGAKWDIKGSASEFPVEWPIEFKGRAFLHSQAVNWIESESKFGACAVEVKGKEEKGGRNWTVKMDSFQAEQAQFFRSLAAAFLPETNPLFDYEWTKGILHGEANAVFSERGVEDWNVLRLNTEGVEIKKGDSRFALQSGEGRFSRQEGNAVLTGGEFDLSRFALRGKDWEGHFDWENGILSPSHFAGWVEAAKSGRIQAGLEVSGIWEDWKIESDLAGFLTGHLPIKGSWRNSGCEFEIETGDLEGIAFSGKGAFQISEWVSVSIPRFEGSLGWLSKIWEGNFGGRIVSVEPGLQLDWKGNEWDWSLQAKVDEGEFDSSLFPFGRLEKGSVEFFVSSQERSFFGIEGNWVRPEGKIHFFSPALIQKGEDCFFDFRCDSEASQSWDLFRCAGSAKGKKIVFDAAKSHIFGVSLKGAECLLGDGGEVERLDLEIVLPWNAVLSAGPFLETFLRSDRLSAFSMPLSGAAETQFHYCKNGGSELSFQGVDLRWKGEPFLAHFHVCGGEGKWEIDRFLLADMDLRCSMKRTEEGFRIENGSGRWGRGAEAVFEGTLSHELHPNLFLKNVKIDLGEISSLTSLFGSSLRKIEGILEGEGHLSYERSFEADFDWVPSCLKAGSLSLENRGPVHLYYSSEKGIFFQGLDLHVLKPQPEPQWDLPWIDCKVGLLQYDAARSRWILNHSLVRVPSELFANLQKKPASFRLFDENQDLQFIADLDFASDFSSLACSMKEGWIPFGGAVRHVKDLQFQWNGTDCKGAFQTEQHGHLLSLAFDVDLDEKIKGFLTLREEGVALEEGQRPLKIDWELAEPGGIAIHAIEGIFPGVDASFHAEANPGFNTLIGTARIDFKTLSEFIPPKISEVFAELSMGKGYELKGRLKFENKQAFFQGLLYGKQYELFGYQFRTLLGQIDVRPDQVRIYDLKLSDSAGTMKIDEILMREERDLWTLSIPSLSIFELRPSLLQKPGKESGPISPLVVRELKIADFKGVLDDSKTYTAKGHLQFINSFKRETTVFDLPADVLSRIVGLDLELLIPVSGSLEFELKDRYFRLIELKEAFSQSHRSEFYLEKGEDPQEPYMDLDGNLKILIKMKQFVLFKFTEAFLISIDGNLSDPQFRLQKKRRFFGL